MTVEHPGVYLRTILDDLGVGVSKFASLCGMKHPNLSRVLNGHAPVTRPFAYRVDLEVQPLTGNIGWNLDFDLARELIERQAAYDWEQEAEERAALQRKCYGWPNPEDDDYDVRPKAAQKPQEDDLEPKGHADTPTVPQASVEAPTVDRAETYRIKRANRRVSIREERARKRATGVTGRDSISEERARKRATSTTGQGYASALSKKREKCPKQRRVVFQSDGLIAELKAAEWGIINLPPVRRMTGGQSPSFDYQHPVTGEPVPLGRYGYAPVLEPNAMLDWLWNRCEDWVIVTPSPAKASGYGPTIIEDAMVMFKSDDEAVLFKMTALPA